MSDSTHKASAFLEPVRTIHYGEVTFQWTEDKLHDVDYHIRVWDLLDAKVRELEAKYNVREDLTYHCQAEGRLLAGESLDDVESAARELSEFLTGIPGIEPLPCNQNEDRPKRATLGR